MKKFSLILALGLGAFNAQAFDLTETANKMADGINNTAQTIEAKKAEQENSQAQIAQAKADLKAKVDAQKAEAKAKVDAAKAERKAKQEEQKEALKNTKNSLTNLKGSFSK